MRWINSPWKKSPFHVFALIAAALALLFWGNIIVDDGFMLHDIIELVGVLLLAVLSSGLAYLFVFGIWLAVGRLMVEMKQGE